MMNVINDQGDGTESGARPSWGEQCCSAEVLTDIPEIHQERTRCSQKNCNWIGNKSVPDKHWQGALVGSAPPEGPSASAVLGLHSSPSDPHLAQHSHTSTPTGGREKLGPSPGGWKRNKKSNCRREGAALRGVILSCSRAWLVLIKSPHSLGTAQGT